MLDPKTLLVCILVLQSLLLVMRIAVFYGRFRDGIAQWTAAGAIEVSMWIVTIVGINLQSAFIPSIVLCGFSIGVACLQFSLHKFLGTPVHWLRVYIPPTSAVVIALLSAAFYAPAYVGINVVLAWQSGVCVAMLLRHKEPGIERSKRWLLWGFVLFGLAAGLRGTLQLWPVGASLALELAAILRLVSLMTAFVTGILINVGLLFMHQDRAWHEHQRLAMSDPLTGALNRRALDLAAKREFSRAGRHQQSLVVAMLDIDFFKKLNDSYGHALGDLALCQFVNTLTRMARTSDVVARYGGEEFCLLLPNCDYRGALQLLERVRQQLLSQPVSSGGPVLRFSAGLTLWNSQDTELEVALKRADAMLYKAKNMGRDQTVFDAM